VADESLDCRFVPRCNGYVQARRQGIKADRLVFRIFVNFHTKLKWEFRAVKSFGKEIEKPTLLRDVG
jgi:hypothetical protein